MKAVYLDKAYSVIVKDVEEPILREDEVLIKVKFAGICGSDIHTFKGLHPFRKAPVIMGHEVVGDIIKTGDKVDHISVGDRVTVEPQYGCGSCDSCLKGDINYCEDRRAPGVKGWIGTMVDYFVAPSVCVHKLTDEMSYEEGVLIEPLAVGVHAARKGDIRFGDKVAILGMGPIGLLTLEVIKAAGASRILVTDVMEYSLDLAKAKGADYTINVLDNPDWIQESLKLNGGQFDKVIVAIGVPNIVNDALTLLRRGGKVITVAMFHEQQRIDIENLQNQEKEVIGSFTYTYEDFKKAIDLVSAKRVQIEDLISHALPVSEAQRGFDLTLNKQENSVKVLLEF